MRLAEYRIISINRNYVWLTVHILTVIKHPEWLLERNIGHRMRYSVVTFKFSGSAVVKTT